MFSLVLLVFAFVLTMVAAFWQSGWRPFPQAGWLGIALYFLSLILTTAGVR